MSLNKQQIKHLRSLSHHIKPVILIGANGVTEAVLNEIHIALAKHELIKIKVRGADRTSRQTMIDRILAETQAEKINVIGHTLSIYKPSEEPKIEIPNK